MADVTEEPRPADPEQLLRESVLALEEQTGRRAFVLVRQFDHLLPDRLTEEIVRVFGKQMPGATGSLDVVLESDGGDADAAYQAVLILRSVTDDLRVLVPSWAKSAATLFSLGGDTIAMAAAFAQLGPLDAQVTDPRNPATTMSALDGYQSIEYLRDYALQTQNLSIGQMLEGSRSRIPLGEVIERAESFTTSVISPIMAHVKPLDFGGWGRTLDIGKIYAERLLASYGMADKGARAARKVANELVYGYPHHGFVIDLNEARKLGLNAVPVDEDEHRLSLAVVERAFDCRQEICDENRHRFHGCYAGFAPDDTAAPVGKDSKEATARKEATNGSEDATTRGDLRDQLSSGTS
jgi:ClpP class serine protease